MRPPGTIFYSKDTDTAGKPLKHVRIPDDFSQYLDERFDEMITTEFDNSSIPINRKERQAFFGFLQRFKKCYDYSFYVILSICITGAITGLVFLIRAMGDK